VNRERLEAAARMLLEALGASVQGEDLTRTPERVAQAWAEDLLSGYAVDPHEVLTWDGVEGDDQGLVVVRGIDFQSVCLHHLLPFTGTAGIAYLPDRRLTGLSKLARLMDAFSRRLQIQERLTEQVLSELVSALQPRGAACLLAAEHQCMSCRGVRRPAARVVTFKAHGACAAPPLREEVLRLLDRPGPS
jgi:GTP cyclohydrolase IA